MMAGGRAGHWAAWMVATSGVQSVDPMAAWTAVHLVVLSVEQRVDHSAVQTVGRSVAYLVGEMVVQKADVTAGMWEERSAVLLARRMVEH